MKRTFIPLFPANGNDMNDVDERHHHHDHHDHLYQAQNEVEAMDIDEEEDDSECDDEHPHKNKLLHSVISKTRKRTKGVRVACDECRRLHKACSEERPCTRCVRNSIGHLCKDSVRKKRGRPRVWSKKGEEDGLEDTRQDDSISQITWKQISDLTLKKETQKTSRVGSMISKARNVSSSRMINTNLHNSLNKTDMQFGQGQFGSQPAFRFDASQYNGFSRQTETGGFTPTNPRYEENPRSQFSCPQTPFSQSQSFINNHHSSQNQGTEWRPQSFANSYQPSSTFSQSSPQDFQRQGVGRYEAKPFFESKMVNTSINHAVHHHNRNDNESLSTHMLKANSLAFAEPGNNEEKLKISALLN